MEILCVDDEPLQLTRLEDSVRKAVPDADVFCYSNPLEALEDSEEEVIDIAFLDIEMPELDGIGLAKKLKAINPRINIIFVTAYNSFAMDAFKLHASGYVSKPVNEEKIKKEIEGLRYPLEMQGTKPVQIKCFGNFEIFAKGQPLKFAYGKSKELIAYLVDREGASINVNELNAVLWEEDHKSYLRNLIADIRSTLEAAGVGKVFIKRHNECYIDINQVDCDAYEYHKGNPDAVRMYRGEYMVQYPWATFRDEDL